MTIDTDRLNLRDDEVRAFFDLEKRCGEPRVPRQRPQLPAFLRRMSRKLWVGWAVVVFLFAVDVVVWRVVG